MGWPRKRNWKEQQNTAGAALQFETFGYAMRAARPGDVISLPPGEHDLGIYCDSDEDELSSHCCEVKHWKLCKSLQIVGSGPATVLRDYNTDAGIGVTGGADLRLANLSIAGDRMEDGQGVVTVRDGSCVWLDACELAIQWLPGIAVHRNSSAVLTGCTFRGGKASAVKVDPQAKRVAIVDCAITGCGEGFEPSSAPLRIYEVRCLPGDVGAIEVSASGWDPVQRSDLQACVKLIIRRTDIVSCFGHALSYRTGFFHKREHQQRYYGGSRHEQSVFSWPGQVEFSLDDNTFAANGLAIPDAADDANAEAFHRNSHDWGYEGDDY